MVVAAVECVMVLSVVVDINLEVVSARSEVEGVCVDDVVQFGFVVSVVECVVVLSLVVDIKLEVVSAVVEVNGVCVVISAVVDIEPKKCKVSHANENLFLYH